MLGAMRHVRRERSVLLSRLHLKNIRNGWIVAGDDVQVV